MGNILTVDLDYILDERQCLSINNLILNKAKEVKKIIFVKSHHNALRFYENEKTLYNVDHHHDCGYIGEEPLNSTYREGNWILYLLRKNLLNRYVWIHNLKSDLKTQNLDSLREIEEYNHTINLDVCYNEIFDKMIICESFDYSNYFSPFMFNILIQTCKSVYNEKTIIDGTKNPSSYVR